MTGARAALALALAVAAGCTQRTQLLPMSAPACSGTGMPVRFGSACAATLAAKQLRAAVCSCQSLVLTGDLATEDGGPMPPPPGPGPMPGAAVATNGSLQIGGQTQIAGGALATGGMSFGGGASVFGTLHAGQSVSATQFLAVGMDAFVGGDVLGRVDIGGELHVVPGAAVAATVSARDTVIGPLPPVLPCDCGMPAVDVAGLVAAAHDGNGDGAIGLDSNAATPPTLNLPCGVYYVARLQASGGLTIAVHGRAALFVDGDVSLGSLRVDFDPMAELDLVVRGNVTLQGDLVGSVPASLRVWIGGSSLRVAGGRSMAAGVWAPSATLLSDGAVTIVGAIAVGSVSAAGGVTVRFDPRLLAGGSECGDAPVPPLG